MTRVVSATVTSTTTAAMEALCRFPTLEPLTGQAWTGLTARGKFWAAIMTQTTTLTASFGTTRATEARFRLTIPTQRTHSRMGSMATATWWGSAAAGPRL